MARLLQHKGFTLIETLIALLIIAIALTAVILTLQTASRNENALEAKMLSHWVAGNILAQAKLGLIPLPNYPDYQQGQTQMLTHVWYWQAYTKPANAAGVTEWVVSVAKQPQGHIIAERSYYDYAN